MTTDIRMRERAGIVADNIVGTADTLETHASDEECQDSNFTQALDALVFECTTCGWWCEDSERGGDGDDPDVCEDWRPCDD